MATNPIIATIPVTTEALPLNFEEISTILNFQPITTSTTTINDKEKNNDNISINSETITSLKLQLATEFLS